MILIFYTIPILRSRSPPRQSIASWFTAFRNRFILYYSKSSLVLRLNAQYNVYKLVLFYLLEHFTTVHNSNVYDRFRCLFRFNLQIVRGFLPVLTENNLFPFKTEINYYNQKLKNKYCNLSITFLLKYVIENFFIISHDKLKI